MQYSRSAIKVFTIITISVLATQSLAQSGRGRPKVPQPSSSPSQPAAVVNIPAATAVINKEQVGNTSRFVLKNGITVIISELHSTPLAAAVARFKAGSLDEPWSLSPIAKMVGRLILKGTVLRPGDQAVAELRSAGASITADTSYDGATYSVVAPPDKLKTVLGIQADMIQNSALDADSVRRQIQLFTDQLTRGGTPIDREFHSRAFSTRSFESNDSDHFFSQTDDPSVYSLSRMFNIALAGTSSPSLESLRSVTRDQLVEFYRSHFRPDNLIISVAGDVSTFNTLVEIQQLYGNFGVTPSKPQESKTKTPDIVKPKSSSARPSAAPLDSQTQPSKPTSPLSDTIATVKPWGTTEQDKLRYAADRADLTQSVVSVAFHTPGAESKDWPVIETLSAVLGQGRASRLSRSLIDGQMAASRVESDYLAYAGTGLLTVQIWPAKDSGEGSAIDKAESSFFKELDLLRRETPADGEMARAKAILEKRFVDQSATYVGRARSIAHAEATGKGFRAALDYRSRIRAVTPEDVQRVAAKYLTLANTTIHEYEPLTAAARTFDAVTFATTVVAWAPGIAQPVESGTVRATEPSSFLAPVAQGSERPPDRQAMLESVQALPVRDFSTLNGPRAFVREDHSRQTVTVAILFQGGRLIEETATSGTTELMLRSILYGTPRRTYSQITQELEQLGADVSIVVEPDFFGFVLSALSRNADRALKLLRDMIEEPAFRNDDVSRARLGQMAMIRDSRDSGVARSRELLYQALFPGHPYSLPPHGREEVVTALTSEKLTEWYTRVIGRQLPLAIIVGDTDGSALVSSQLAEGFKRRDTDAALQVRTPQSSAASEKTESRRSEQSAVAVGTTGPRAGSVDLIAVELFKAVMNGEGGRLFRELQDKQIPIWTAELSGEAMFVAGVIGAYATIPPEHEQRARAVLLAEFERMARGGLTADELASARALAATSRTIRLQSQQHHAINYARAIFYKQQAADVDSFSDQVSKITFDDVKRVAAANLKTTASSAGVVRGTAQTTTPTPPRQD